MPGVQPIIAGQAATVAFGSGGIQRPQRPSDRIMTAGLGDHRSQGDTVTFGNDISRLAQGTLASPADRGSSAPSQFAGVTFGNNAPYQLATV